MFKTQPAKSALRAARRRQSIQSPQAQQFSATPTAAALSPHNRRNAKPLYNKQSNEAGAKRDQSTAAATALSTTRPVPSPAFNQESSRNEVYPLQGMRAPQMDDSMVGKSGGEIFHEMMLRQGVECIFGYPGGAILPVFDSIFNSKHFEFILPRHEQSAGHMAQGYSRASGKPGVVLVTSGPGATNVITPMQDALLDGTPLVVFAGQVVTGAIGTDAFQEADIIGISRPASKWNTQVKSVAELPKRIKEAFEIATSGRPGPVLVDLPKDVQAAILRHPIPLSSSLPTHPSAASLAARELSKKQLEGTIQRVASLINISKKPIIYAGQGIASSPGGPELLKKLADKANIPVTTTLQGLGGYDELESKSLHMLGMHGSAYANMAMQESDLIIALGARFDDRVTGSIPKFAPQARLAAAEKRGGIVHFEVLPKNINKVVQATEAVEGDVVANVELLLPLVERRAERPEWFSQINDWKKRFPFDYARSTPDGLIKPQAIIEALSDLTPDSSLITTGVGQHQMWTAQHYRWRHPRTMITSGGLGTMGFGLPAAIGAKVASPNSTVIDIDGDASLQMTITELTTAAQFNIGVKVIVLNNEEQGMVTQWQSLFFENRFSHTHQANPDFVKVAEAMGVKADRCIKPDDVENKLKWLLNTDGPALLEFVVDKKVGLFPMVPAGRGLHEMLVFDREKDKVAHAQRLASMSKPKSAN